MIAQTSYTYIYIGLWLRHLRAVTAKTSADDVLKRIGHVTAALRDVNFEVSMASTRSTRYKEMVSKLNDFEANAEIGTTLASNIVKRFTTLEDVVYAEATTKMIYIIPQRRFNSEFLLSSPEKLLKEGAFEKLEEIAQSDFSSACRCISFGEGTAAAFHILRATESTLKKYYFHHRRQNRLEKPMWANIIDQLKAKKKNRPPASLLTTLDLIRDVYRNPTQHPQLSYEIDAAQDLFGVCSDVIGKMTAEL